VYNTAGNVTLQTVSFRSYSSTTEYAYDDLGNNYWRVDPYEYGERRALPGASRDDADAHRRPYLGATITTYDADGEVSNPPTLSAGSRTPPTTMQARPIAR